MNWNLLILSLPTENATARMRAWRALKASGAAVLRDGVYLLPDRGETSAALTVIANDVRDHGGAAYLLPTAPTDDREFPALFSRSNEFAALLPEISQLHTGLAAGNAAERLKTTRKLRKTFGQLTAIDFFPGEAQRQVGAALQELEAAIARALSPDEPQTATGDLPRLAAGDYRGRVWATRARPWVDRLASAWLIRRFVDPDARFLWLAAPADCPAEALGFDFDGAAFSHVGNRVTFEALTAGFGLETPALQRLGGLVHFLDVGGVQPPEADGIERVLSGLRDAIPDDDRLLAAATPLFDGLLSAFDPQTPPAGKPTP